MDNGFFSARDTPPYMSIAAALIVVAIVLTIVAAISFYKKSAKSQLMGLQLNPGGSLTGTFVYNGDIATLQNKRLVLSTSASAVGKVYTSICSVKAIIPFSGIASGVAMFATPEGTIPTNITAPIDYTNMFSGSEFAVVTPMW